MEKPDPHRPSLPHVVTINRFQVLLSSITCLSPAAHREKVFALLFPHQVYVPHPISKWLTRPLPHSLYPGYKSGLRTPVLEKEMATHSSILAWRILWTEKPGALLSMGSHRVRHNWSDLACMHALEKEMATHRSILAWRIPGTEEPGGLPSMGSHRVGHDWIDLAAAARIPVQRWFSLELAHCSNSVSHSNKLYFSLILSHVWKSFSNPCPDHDTHPLTPLTLPQTKIIIISYLD